MIEESAGLDFNGVLYVYSFLPFYLSDMNVRREWDLPQRGNEGMNDYSMAATNSQTLGANRSAKSVESKEGKFLCEITDKEKVCMVKVLPKCNGYA